MFQDFNLNFNATQYDPKQPEGGICLPLADYLVEITNIAQVAVKDNPNKGYIEVSLTVLDGQYKGQIQKDRLNVYGQDEMPTRIGFQRLSAYAHIAGKLQLPNAGMLLGTKLIATCGPQLPPNDKYSEVKMVKDIAGNAPVLGQPAAPQPAPGQSFGVGQQQPFQPQQQQQGGAWNNPAQQPQQQLQTAFTPQNVPLPNNSNQPAPSGGWDGGQQQPQQQTNKPAWAQ